MTQISEYSLRLTVACPAALTAAANQLALAIGEQPGDDQTFGAADWSDSDGNQYALCSTVATPALIGRAMAQLQAPEHAPGVDLQAAADAQAAVVLWVSGQDEGPPPAAAPGQLVGIVHGDALEAVEWLGVGRG